MSMDWFADVLEFERAVGARYRTTPGPFPDKTRLRARLINEEYRETFAALQKLHVAAAGTDAELPEHLGAVADGLADLIFVCIGTAITFGVDLRPVWDAVAAANLAKAGGPRDAWGKIMKPPGWSHPDIAAIVAAAPPLPEPVPPPVMADDPTIMEELIG